MFRLAFASLRRQLPHASSAVLLGLFGIGTAASFLLVDFANGLGFRIPFAYFFVFLSFALVVIVLLPELYHNLRSRVVDFVRKYPLRVLLLIGILSRLVFGMSMSLFPDEYTVTDLLARIPLFNLGYFLTHYLDYAQTLASHPPLSFLIMLPAYRIYPTASSIRLVSAAFSIASVILVYKLVLEIGRPTREAFLTALLYASIPHTLMFMDLALTDVYMNFFGILSILFLLRSLRLRALGFVVLSGISLGLSFWSKQGLPFFWAALLLVAALVFQGSHISPLRRFGYAVLACSTAGSIFALWWLINPNAFYMSTYSFLFLVLVTINPAAYQWLSQNVPVTSTITTISNGTIVTTVGAGSGTCYAPGLEGGSISAFLAGVFPRLCRSGYFISYPELLIQTPFWLTPLVLLFSLFGILLRRGRERIDLFMGAWAILPLFAMLPWFRDIRYLVIFAPAVAYFAMRGMGTGSRDFQRLTLSLALSFVLVFSGVAFVVGQQQYYGPPQAVEKLQELGLERGPILTNWIALKFLLQRDDVYLTEGGGSIDGIRYLILVHDVDAVVFFHNARASPQSPTVEIRLVVKEMFPLYYKEGPSNFAWFEIFYRSGTKATQLNFLRQDWAPKSYSASSGPVSAGDMLVLTSWDVSQNYQRQLREQGTREQGAKVLQPLIELQSS